MVLVRLLMLLLPLSLFSQQPSNVFIYKDNVQVNSEINTYENVQSGQKIQGTVMITHDANAAVDKNSFSMGGKSLKVELVENMPMSSTNSLEVSVYQFQLDGMSAGIHRMPPIKVKVGGKEYAAPPLTIQVGDW